jgi:hypothetical protein
MTTYLFMTMYHFFQLTYEVTVGVVMLIIYLFNIPAFTANDNLLAVFATIELFG